VTLRRVVVAAALAGALGVSGCASSIMEGFVGQPLQMAMVRYGPPENVFDMPDGRRAFQWKMTSSGVVAGSSTTTYSGNVYAPPGGLGAGGGTTTFNVKSRTTTTPAQVISHTCLYTMYATWNEGSKTWTFVGIEKPNFMCE